MQLPLEQKVIKRTNFEVILIGGCLQVFQLVRVKVLDFYAKRLIYGE